MQTDIITISHTLLVGVAINTTGSRHCRFYSREKPINSLVNCFIFNHHQCSAGHPEGITAISRGSVLLQTF
jgi:hypothetical protein